MRILDLSAGNRAMWFNKNDPRCTYLDKREVVNPDFVCDTTDIPQEVGCDYDLVVFDPPHENTGANGHMTKRYGHSTRREIIETIIGSGKEAHRVTKPNALMAFKWNDHAFTLDKVLELLSPYWEPLFGSHMRNRGGMMAKTQSFWVMLLRRDIPTKENGVSDDNGKVREWTAHGIMIDTKQEYLVEEFEPPVHVIEKSAYDKLKADRDHLRQLLSEASDVIDFYANHDNWAQIPGRPGTYPLILGDCDERIPDLNPEMVGGKRAREILTKLNKTLGE